MRSPRATRGTRKRALRAGQVGMRYPTRGYQTGDRRGRLAQRPEKPSRIGYRRGSRPPKKRPGSSSPLDKVNYISARHPAIPGAGSPSLVRAHHEMRPVPRGDEPHPLFRLLQGRWIPLVALGKRDHLHRAADGLAEAVASAVARSKSSKHLIYQVFFQNTPIGVTRRDAGGA